MEEKVSQKKDKSDQPPEKPKGALVVTLIYLATIIILWSYVYLILFERGTTI